MGDPLISFLTREYNVNFVDLKTYRSNSESKNDIIVQQRFLYTIFGQPTSLNGSFAVPFLGDDMNFIYVRLALIDYIVISNQKISLYLLDKSIIVCKPIIFGTVSINII
jgi:hypothetical protein